MSSRAKELRDACHTLSGMPVRDKELATRLQYIASLLTDAGSLPAGPLLAWRDSDQCVRHVIIREHFIVGRGPEGPGLRLPEDKLLSRSHFSICMTEEGWLLRNLNSKNGTAVNEPGKTVHERLMRDGDLIVAGNHIFAFLNQT